MKQTENNKLFNYNNNIPFVLVATVSELTSSVAIPIAVASAMTSTATAFATAASRSSTPRNRSTA